MHLPSKLRSVNAVKLSIISICVLIFGIVFGFYLFPWLLKTMIKHQINLKPSNKIRPMYTKVPFPIDFRIYMFNLTNKDEVHKGGKPRLQQIGPYYFEEWKEKFDLIDDDKDDTLTYHYKNTFIFRADLSGPGLTGNEIITMPNPVLAGMILAVNVDKKPMLTVVKNAVNLLFHEPSDIFWTGRVMDILFDGVPIDCSSSEFSAQAVCSVFESGDVKAVKQINETSYTFSLFAAANGTDLGEFKVFRGAKNSKDIGRVISFNGETEMEYWHEDECNQYVGTDSTIFPPFLEKEEGVWAYEPSICRSMGITYRHPSKYMGVPTLRYEMDLGEDVNVKQCFCRNPPDECPPKGTFDLFHCVGSPMFGSLPHFYLADPKLVENFASGINPTKEEHGIFLDFEIMTGTPLSAAKRLQFNLEIIPIEQVEIMKDLQPMLYPLFWVEESAHLNKTFVNMLKYRLFLAIKIQNYIKWLCVFGGILGMILAGIINYMKENAVVEVTATTTKK